MTTQQKLIGNKFDLLRLAERLGNVSKACNIIGYSRDSYYRFNDVCDASGELAVQEISSTAIVLTITIERTTLR